MPEVERIGDEADEDDGTGGKELRESCLLSVVCCPLSVVRSRGPTGPDEEGGAEAWREGGETGERGLFGVEKAGDEDGREADRTKEFAQKARRGGCEGWENGNDRAAEQFPCARR